MASQNEVVWRNFLARWWLVEFMKLRRDAHIGRSRSGTAHIAAGDRALCGRAFTEHGSMWGATPTCGACVRIAEAIVTRATLARHAR